jgi:methionyl-tRNA synthetase
MARANSELLANLGNFVNRTCRFVFSKLNGVIPQPSKELSDADHEFISQKIDPEIKQYHDDMEGIKLRSALKAVMNISAAGNLYLSEQRLDGKLLVNDAVRCQTVLYISLNLCYHLGALLAPFLPSTSEQIYQILNVKPRKLPVKFTLDLSPNHPINPPVHLFEKIDEKLILELSDRFKGNCNVASKSVSEAAASGKKKN